MRDRAQRPMGPHSCMDGANLIELADQFRVATRGCARMAGPNEVVVGRKPRRVAEPPKPKVKVGRNERCPCGSGKKFKTCCGA